MTAEPDHRPRIALTLGDPAGVGPELAVKLLARPETVAGLSEAEARFEAQRCFSCGNCFECDGCFGACPEHAIEKLGTARVDLKLPPDAVRAAIERTPIEELADNPALLRQAVEGLRTC